MGLCRASLLHLAIAFLLPLSAFSVSRAFASGDRELHMLLIGEVYPQECPLPLLFDNDPLFDYVAIRTREGPAGQLTDEMKQRYVKLYFPRTESELREFSMIFYVDADVSVFSGSQAQQMYDSVADGVAGSFFTFGPEFWSVSSSILGEFVPHDMSQPINMDWTRRSYRVMFVRDMPPVFTPFIELGVESAVGIGCGFLSPRGGTTVWGNLLPRQYGPWIIEWKFGGGGGHCWTVADDLDHSWWGDIHSSIHGLSQNPWAMDIMSNLILFSSGWQLPDDVVVVALARDGFWEYRTERSIILSLMDWVEKFGASTIAFGSELIEIDDYLGSATDLYLSGDYQGALSELDAAKSEAVDLRVRVLGAKDRALFWVYLTEYLAITGTSVLAGSLLWALMVRRKLYREIGYTRSMGA
jgi:hypothetical protein